MLEVRKALEELAVQLACERMDEEGLEALKKAAKEFEESLGSEDVTESQRRMWHIMILSVVLQTIRG